MNKQTQQVIVSAPLASDKQTGIGQMSRMFLTQCFPSSPDLSSMVMRAYVAPEFTVKLPFPTVAVRRRLEFENLLLPIIGATSGARIVHALDYAIPFPLPRRVRAIATVHD